MSKSYYAYIDGVVSDLYTRGQIERLHTEGVITDETKICRENETEWHVYTSLFNVPQRELVRAHVVNEADSVSSKILVRPKVVQESSQKLSPGQARKMPGYGGVSERITTRSNKRIYWVAVCVAVVVAMAVSAIYFSNQSAKAQKKAKTDKNIKKLSRDIYIANFDHSLSFMKKTEGDASQIIANHQSAWRAAIQDKYMDVSLSVRDSVRNQQGSISRLITHKEIVKDTLQRMQGEGVLAPPDDLVGTHRELVELYAVYVSYLDLAISPRGNYKSYLRECSDSRNEFLKLYRKLEVLSNK